MRSCFSSASVQPEPASCRFQLAALSRGGAAGSTTGTSTVTVSVAPVLSLTPTTTSSGLRPGAAGAVPVTVPSAPTEAQAAPPSLR